MNWYLVSVQTVAIEGPILPGDPYFKQYLVWAESPDRACYKVRQNEGWWGYPMFVQTGYTS